ncbi:hypothetical protein MTR67_016738 [Solanum verrucosum]|uniref:Uncharacterized protein n=1 Tax=Solanum verrucosum TaxID=315347 RepID=A0AAF0QHS3_SOLVR|nr:hypothetical protein MTR67_016738 [Solanum verrucosum]
MKIKKEIMPQVLHQVNLVISFSETFNYILPYWNLDKAKQLVNGARKGVAMFNEDAGKRLPVTFGELWISFFAMFDYILPYWKLELARSLVNGNVAHVGLWDVTEKKCGRTNRYEDVSFSFRKLCSDDYSLTCMTLINDRGLGVGDEILLCWNPIISKFMFKLI